MMNRKRTTVLLVIVFMVGLSLILYPTISNYWNTRHASTLIADYDQAVDLMDDNTRLEMLEKAREYNHSLTPGTAAYRISSEQQKIYNNILNIGGTGVMGYVEIPAISVSLPIYHGTDPEILQIAVGHLDWTSLPVGGKGTHAVLSGHRGLPRARLFTDLDDLQIGDIFLIRVLNETLTYEVDQIVTREPQQTDDLKIVSGKDYCTLVTCTPYGVNSHRLLVRGHRIETTLQNKLRVTADAVTISENQVALVLGIALLILLVLIFVLLPYRKRRTDDSELTDPFGDEPEK